jgi:hypothetical protein
MKRRIIGRILLVPGTWALIAPQASLGLPELRWMAQNSFPGEALVGVVLLGLAYYLSGQIPSGKAEGTRDSNPSISK